MLDIIIGHNKNVHFAEHIFSVKHVNYRKVDNAFNTSIGSNKGHCFRSDRIYIITQHFLEIRNDKLFGE